MSTTCHTFIEIFNSPIDSEAESFNVNKIVIPIIQRDYAQGRTTNDIRRLRSRFLDSLYNAMNGNPITLDFIYGDIDEDGVMTPLDGQQRLTTLFLLHWYVAKKENIDKNEYAFLKNFSYETRYSARDFCNELIDFTPSFESKISDEIVDQAWFPLEWKKDPTISSMLVMIDAIAMRFADLENMWESLKNGAISFYFLPIRDMGLTDELYIKMNSRGKPLTQFEHFKAELERNLKDVNVERSKQILEKVDIAWTDMLWKYRGEDNVIDDEFLRYFKFICDVICYRENGSPHGRSYDEFLLLDCYFKKGVKNVDEHIDTLETFFDCWYQLDEGTAPYDFFSQIFANEHEQGKVQIKGELDIFEECLNYYAISYGRNRRFPLNRFVLLYAVIMYLLNKQKITTDELVRRLRIVNNLIRNSENELSDSEARSSGNRIPAILKQVDSIIVDGIINNTIEKGFNGVQIEEEIQKDIWVNNNPESAEELYTLEDHQLLFGQIGIVGIDSIELAGRFKELFDCKLDLVDSALMSVGNYSQRARNNWRYQLGTSNNRVLKAWQDLFHKSANYEYDRTKNVLKCLLQKAEHFDNDVLRGIIDEFITGCEEKNIYDIRYYYVKYDCFRPGYYGMYDWDDFDNNPYKLLVMRTEKQISQSSYQPFLYAVDNTEALSKDNCGRSIIHGDKYIVCENDAYVLKLRKDKSIIDKFEIKQNEDGIDCEDRIKRFKEFYDMKRW